MLATSSDEGKLPAGNMDQKYSCLRNRSSTVVVRIGLDSCFRGLGGPGMAEIKPEILSIVTVDGSTSGGREFTTE
jgi:hypothetical protein